MEVYISFTSNQLSRKSKLQKGESGDRYFRLNTKKKGVSWRKSFVMNKMRCLITIITLAIFNACQHGVTLDSNVNTDSSIKSVTELHSEVLLEKQNDTLISQTKIVYKKLSCCVAPPSRFDSKADKK
ncbi:MAG: hypothetical protein JWQ96_723 [Segetibacter sp.]|nr:hypothetical protein [Segetibacter sp.]